MRFLRLITCLMLSIGWGTVVLMFSGLAPVQKTLCVWWLAPLSVGWFVRNLRGLRGWSVEFSKDHVRVGKKSMRWKDVKQIWPLPGMIRIEGSGDVLIIRNPVFGRRTELFEKLLGVLPPRCRNVWNDYSRVRWALLYAWIVISLNLALFWPYRDVLQCLAAGAGAESTRSLPSVLALTLIALHVTLIAEPRGLAAIVLVATIFTTYSVRVGLNECLGEEFQLWVMISNTGQLLLITLIIYLCVLRIQKILSKSEIPLV